MSSTELRLGSSSNLVNQGEEMQDELSYIKENVTKIYETFDLLKESWKGEKADKYKATIEEIRIPLQLILKSADAKSVAINNVGKILSDYHNK